MNIMKEKLQNKYLAWGLTAFCVLAALLLLFFAMYNSKYIIGFIKKVFVILTPFVYGLVIAYLMNPVVTFFDEKVYSKLLDKVTKKKKDYKKVIRCLSLITSSAIFIGCLLTCLSFLFPEIMKSLEMLVTNINTYLANSKDMLINLTGNSEGLTTFINENFSKLGKFVNTWIDSFVFEDMLTMISNSIFGTLKFLYNLIIGYIISIYVLFDKEKFKAQIKKLLYTFFDNETINVILENIRYTDRVFGGFFTGKLIDSLIIGILCFIAMLVLDMPYALIIAVIVGVTNIIPYFGPFIGAIPSFCLIFLVSPGKSIVFLIFILILQQFDGNILGPKILGSKTGLSSFWVLFSLLIFGGLFGVVGMIIGVPIFSILYSFVNGLIKKRLKDKNLPVDSKDYTKLLYVDQETGKLIYEK